MRSPSLPELDSKWAVFLDFDGTLVPIAARPDAIRWRPPHGEQLMRLRRSLHGALAIVSGRAVDDVARTIAPATVAIAGHHGLERRDAVGRHVRFEFDTAALARTIRDLKVLSDRHPGIEVEEKGLSVAVHYRRAPQLAGLVCDALGRVVRDLGERYALRTGKMVVEIMPAGRDKGTVIAEFMAEAPFQGRRPVFVGDDDTDEAGFAAVCGMDGISVKVGPGATIADRRLRSVAQVWTWLNACAQILESARG